MEAADAAQKRLQQNKRDVGLILKNTTKSRNDRLETLLWQADRTKTTESSS